MRDEQETNKKLLQAQSVSRMRARIRKICDKDQQSVSESCFALYLSNAKVCLHRSDSPSSNDWLRWLSTTRFSSLCLLLSDHAPCGIADFAYIKESLYCDSDYSSFYSNLLFSVDDEPLES